MFRSTRLWRPLTLLAGYSYFRSKSDLYVEALSCFFTDPNWKSTWVGIEIDLDASLVGPQVVSAYLSRQHFENVDESCPMVALPSDVARGGRKAKQAFENVFRAIVRFLESDVRGRDGADTTAQAIAALCIGGMVVARAMDDRVLADGCDACLGVALRLGGWQKRPKPRSERKKWRE
jgi:hypothetical protein